MTVIISPLNRSIRIDFGPLMDLESVCMNSDDDGVRQHPELVM